MNKDIVALSILAAAEVAHAFSAYMPSSFTIKNWVLDGDPGAWDGRIANLRSGYRPAILFGLALSGAVSILARSWVPLGFGAGTAYLMIHNYEAALPQALRLSGQGAVEYLLPALPDLAALGGM